MTYKTSDIIKKARQLSDLTNSDFLSWDEQIGLLNDSYTTLYQKLLNQNDGSFVNTFMTSIGETVLPPDFWQLKSVSVYNNGNIIPVKRRSDSETLRGLYYEIKFDRLYVYGNAFVGEIMVEYFAKPVTLTFKPEPAILQPIIPEGYTVLAVWDNMFFATKVEEGNTTLVITDLKTNITKSLPITGQTVTKIIPSNNQAYIETDTYKYILSYVNLQLTPFEGIPVILENGTIAKLIITETTKQIFIGNHYVLDWDDSMPLVEDEATASVIICDENLTNFWYLLDGNIWHNGIKEELNGFSIAANSITYKNGNCWYCTTDEVGYVDNWDNLTIVDNKPGILGINKLDENTGYGYTVLNWDGDYTCFPWVEDTVLNFPNSFYFQLLSYMLAVQYKIKQGADATGLQQSLASYENTFYDTLSQNASDPVRIKNVY